MGELSWKYLVGDVRAVLKSLPEKSIQCVITSPPYWNMRRYVGEQAVIWGGDEKCEHDFKSFIPSVVMCLNKFKMFSLERNKRIGGVNCPHNFSCLSHGQIDYPTVTSRTPDLGIDPLAMKKHGKPDGKFIGCSRDGNTPDGINTPVPVNNSANKIPFETPGKRNRTDSTALVRDDTSPNEPIPKSNGPESETINGITSPGFLGINPALHSKDFFDCPYQTFIKTNKGNLSVRHDASVCGHEPQTISEVGIDFIEPGVEGNRSEFAFTPFGTKGFYSQLSLPTGPEEDSTTDIARNGTAGVTTPWTTILSTDLARLDPEKTAARRTSLSHASNIFQVCIKCVGIKCALGLEPPLEMYISHLVEIFQEVRRVLKDDGTVALNIGDCYTSSGKLGGHGKTAKIHKTIKDIQGRAPTPPNLKPKNLLEIPSRIAMALQDDGWNLRSRIPWLKHNPGPESCTDRPASAVEYFFLLTKNNRCYWDGKSVKMKGKIPAGTLGGKGSVKRNSEPGVNAFPPKYYEYTGMRNRRNMDWFMDSLQTILQGEQGMLVDGEGEPLAIVVNPVPGPGVHFAVFPPKLVEPFILAGSRLGDIVLDPFAGSGTTLLVARRLGRSAIGIDISVEYEKMARKRAMLDTPDILSFGGDEDDNGISQGKD